MKKLFIAALLAVTVSASTFAEDNNNRSIAAGNFGFEFKKASNVAWTTTDDYIKATFTLDNQRMEAYYNLDGEKIGTSKSISLAELPVDAKRKFAAKYEGYTVMEAIRFEGDDEKAYYISAENEIEAVILKVSDNNQVSVFKSAKK